MSYLLKALEKAQKERETSSENKVEYIEHVPTSSIPRWLVYCIVLVLVLTVLKVLGLFSWISTSQDEYANEPSVVGEVPNIQVAQEAPAALQKKIDPADQADKIYTLMELTPDQLALLPSIELQSHIYSPRSEMRSVIINDQSYKEGDLLSASVGLNEITNKGVVLKVGSINVYLDKGITWVAK